MRKPLEIVAWAVMSIIAAICVLNVADIEPHNTGWQASVRNFGKRLSLYKKRPPAECMVVIGASYAQGIDAGPHTINLAIGSTTPPEHAFIVRRYCRNQVTVLYIVTVRESVITVKTPRIFDIMPITNGPLILRHNLRAILFPGGTSFNPRSPKQAEIDLIVKSLNMERLDSNQAKALLWQIKAFTPDVVSIDHLEAVVANRKAIFILHPFIPIQSVQDTCALGKQINKLVAAKAEFSRLFRESGLTYYDLTDLLPVECFRDTCHLTPEGKEMLRSHLLSIIGHASG